MRSELPIEWTKKNRHLDMFAKWIRNGEIMIIFCNFLSIQKLSHGLKIFFESWSLLSFSPSSLSPLPLQLSHPTLPTSLLLHPLPLSPSFSLSPLPLGRRSAKRTPFRQSISQEKLHSFLFHCSFWVMISVTLTFNSIYIYFRDTTGYWDTQSSQRICEEMW